MYLAWDIVNFRQNKVATPIKLWCGNFFSSEPFFCKQKTHNGNPFWNYIAFIMVWKCNGRIFYQCEDIIYADVSRYTLQRFHFRIFKTSNKIFSRYVSKLADRLRYYYFIFVEQGKIA